MEGYSERQEDEVDFLQAVFPAGEFEDLKLNDPWKVRARVMISDFNDKNKMTAIEYLTSSKLYYAN